MDRIEPRSESERQTAHRAMQVECRQRPRHLGRHCETPGNPDSSTNGVLHRQDDARAAGGDHRHIARELNGIAQPFVGIDQDGLAFDARLAEPHGFSKFRIGQRDTELASAPRARPASLEIAGHHLQAATGSSPPRVVGIDRSAGVHRSRRLPRTGASGRAGRLVVDRRDKARPQARSRGRTMATPLRAGRANAARRRYCCRCRHRRIERIAPAGFRPALPRIVFRPRRKGAQLQRRGVVRLQFVAQVENASASSNRPRRRADPALMCSLPMARIELERVLKAQQRVRRPLQVHKNVAEVLP